MEIELKVFSLLKITFALVYSDPMLSTSFKFKN